MSACLDSDADSRPWTHHDAGDWMIRVRPGRTSAWFGEAKRKADGCWQEHGLLEPFDCDIYFTFGDTEAEVVRKLKRELLN